MNRRNFIKKFSLGSLALTFPNYLLEQKIPKKIKPYEFSKLPSPDYYNISSDRIKWENFSKGLDFSRTNIYRAGELVDIISTIKINPENNKIKVFNGYNEKRVEKHFIDKWQEKTNALVMINSGQYGFDPLYYPEALVICDGKQKGPKKRKGVRGMLVAEPTDLENKLKKADLLDFKYDSFDHQTTPYTQGVQHWPILLDRNGKIRVNSTLWQASRTVVSKTKDNELLFMTTEGGYFTLYNFGKFLKESDQKGNGFNIHTAMNLDGAYPSQMIIKTPSLDYLNYGKFVRRDPTREGLPFEFRQEIPGVIGVFPRN